MGPVRAREMRIVAGEFRGRRIHAPVGRTTRPTAERTREAVFSILGDIGGATVLDLFAGSGALGLEALSRGAARATFIDRSREAIAALSRNVEALGVAARAVSIRGDLRSTELLGGPFDLVFVDPPYAQADDWGALLSRELARALRPGARVVTESDRRSPLALALPLRLERRYGDTLIRIHHASET